MIASPPWSYIVEVQLQEQVLSKMELWNEKNGLVPSDPTRRRLRDGVKSGQKHTNKREKVHPISGPIFEFQERVVSQNGIWEPEGPQGRSFYYFE